jgi:hypothetical protein
LKKLLTTALVLAQPDIEKLFDIYCDASGIVLECVLMHEGRIIAYASRQLRQHDVTPGFGRKIECEPCTCEDQKFTYTVIT